MGLPAFWRVAIRLAILLVPACLAVLALMLIAPSGAEAGLLDNESYPLPAQYYDRDHGFNLTFDDINSSVCVRRDGGIDEDFLRLPSFAVGDLVTVNVSQNDSMAALCEYWVSDPDGFPIFQRSIDFITRKDRNWFEFDFAVITAGHYWFHTGSGIGDTRFNLTIKVVHIAPPWERMDANNRPHEMVALASGEPETEPGGLPWDPSDFYYVDPQLTADTKWFLSIRLDNDTGTKVDWELYNSTTVLRPSSDYRSDMLVHMAYRDRDNPLLDWRIPATDAYIIRIWVKEGYGSYTLTVDVTVYPDDHNDSIDEAYLLGDDTELSSDVHPSFDRDDYSKIFLETGQPLWAVMTPEDGPADLFLQDANGNQMIWVDRPGLEEETVLGFSAPAAGFYVILVSAVYEDAFPDPSTVGYSLKVWINYAPIVNPSPPPPTTYDVAEDTVDDTILVTAWFRDNDGDPLSYDVDAFYDSARIEISVNPDGTLHIAPGADESGFSVDVYVTAIDPHWLVAEHMATITITPVNDAPYVDMRGVSTEITVAEDLVKTGVNVTRPFRDVDDGYSTWRFTATSTTHVRVELEPITWFATFTTLVRDWYGAEHFNVTCTDSGGLAATVQYTIEVFDINDPPVIVNYLPQITIDEGQSYLYDLEDPAKPAFRDVEGWELTYDWSDNGSVMVSVENGVLNLTGMEGFSGIITGMKLWALDRLGARSANMTLLITVEGYLPMMSIILLKPTVTVQEGQGVKFEPEVYYRLVDPYSQGTDLTWRWFVDEVEVPPAQIPDKSAYELVTAMTAEKDRTVTVRLDVSGALGSASATFTVNVTNKNAEPGGLVITQPSIADHKYEPGRPYTFSADATDIDGDTLTYEWFLDRTTSLGFGRNITVRMEPGTHWITIKVTDPQGAMSVQETNIDVRAYPEEQTGPFAVVAIILVLAVASAALIALRRRC